MIILRNFSDKNEESEFSGKHVASGVAVGIVGNRLRRHRKYPLHRLSHKNLKKSEEEMFRKHNSEDEKLQDKLEKKS